jgi:uncharacterized protein
MRKWTWLVCAVIGIGLPAFAQQGAGGSATPGSVDQTPSHPVTVDQVHEMLQLTGYSNLKKQMVANMVPYLKQAMPFIPADVLDDFQGRMEKADFETMIVKSYQAHLSTEDAAQMIIFYKTPAGRHMISQMPLILKETQQAGAELGQKTMGDVIAAHKTEVEDAARKYQQSGGAPQQ